MSFPLVHFLFTEGECHSHLPMLLSKGQLCEVVIFEEKLLIPSLTDQLITY